MPTPYDEFGRDYPSAMPTPPSPAVKWVETNTLGLDFVLPVGEPEAYNQAIASKPNGTFRTWSWHQNVGYDSSSPPTIAPAVSITITGKGGSFTTALALYWNNENSWNSLQVFQRASLGGIDLDWMIVGCNAVLLPYPKGQMPFENVLFPGGEIDFFLAIGFKIMTPNGSSQFFYPGAKTLFMQTGMNPSNNNPSPLKSVSWVPVGANMPQVGLSNEGFYSNTAAAPIIPVSGDNLSPYVQLPIFGAFYDDVCMEGQEIVQNAPNLPFSPPIDLTNIQTESGLSLSYNVWGATSNNYYTELGSVVMTVEAGFTEIIIGTPVNAVLCNQQGSYPAEPGNPDNAGISVVAYGAVGVNLEVDSLSWTESLVVNGGTYTNPQTGQKYSWPDLYSLLATATFIVSIDPTPLSYVWGGIPGGCGVIPPSNPVNGLNTLDWWIYGNPYQINGYNPTAIPGSYTYPIMQVPVGPDTFLVSF